MLLVGLHLGKEECNAEESFSVISENSAVGKPQLEVAMGRCKHSVKHQQETDSQKEWFIHQEQTLSDM